MRIGFGSVALLFGFCLASTAQAQVPDDLSGKKDFKSLRSSSTDPNGHNGDSRPIDPGATLTVADVHGAGRFTHLWMTIAAAPNHLRELVIRMTWDDASSPAVECPIGDLFAQGPGKYVEFRSAPVSVGGSMALNCYWPMPFKKHAVITVTNEGAERVGAFYYNFDYRLQKSPDRDLRYFHAQYHNYFPAPVGHALTICDVKGAGQFVGTVVTVNCNSNGWWGEGNDMWTIDGDEKPTITGTGSEDYFCGAWDFGHAFQTPYFGVTYYDNPEHGGEKRGITNTVYRWHIQDPVVFTKSLLFQLEHGRSGGDEDRKPFTNNYTTVGLYYVDHPEGDIPPINKLADRLPSLIPLPGQPGE
jgi:hypothetical protein